MTNSQIQTTGNWNSWFSILQYPVLHETPYRKTEIKVRTLHRQRFRKPLSSRSQHKEFTTLKTGHTEW